MVVPRNIGVIHHYILLLVLAHAYNSIIDRGVGAPGYGRYVIDGLNVAYKKDLSILMSKVTLVGSKCFDN